MGPGAEGRGRGALTIASPVGRRPGGCAPRPAPRPPPRPVPRGHAGGAGAPAPLSLFYRRLQEGRSSAGPLQHPLPSHPPRAGPGELPRSWALPPASHSALGGAGTPAPRAAWDRGEAPTSPPRVTSDPSPALRASPVHRGFLASSGTAPSTRQHGRGRAVPLSPLREPDRWGGLGAFSTRCRGT